MLAVLGLGAAWTTVAASRLAAPARADAALDVRILQTASSLEALAVAFYDLVLGQDSQALMAFARESRRQHHEHKRAFQAQLTALDRSATVQDAPNPRFLPIVTGADLATPEKVVDTATVVERLATDTYLVNLTQLEDARAKAVIAGVMGLSAQRLATLRTVRALLEEGAPQLVSVALPQSALMNLPVRVGRAAFPDARHGVGGPDQVADPASGAAS